MWAFKYVCVTQKGRQEGGGMRWRGGGGERNLVEIHLFNNAW